MTKRGLLWALPLALVLAACGGGGGGDDDGALQDGVPGGALESPESFGRWVGARPPSETKDPFAMMDVMPPTSESIEPLDID